ncbi:MAG: phytanoyl-CoA dioxygenase family protein [Pseudonocardiaceae bacterium]
MLASHDLTIAQRQFEKLGFVHLPSVVSKGDARHLRGLIERRYQDPDTHADPNQDYVRGNVSLMRMFEYDRSFRDLLVLEPIISLIERILGADCHVIAQNALRTPTGKAIVNWHIDDALFFPFLAQLSSLPREVSPLPCYSLNVMIALSDVDAEEFGPTQIVAASHLTGRVPDRSPTLPSGMVPRSLFAQAGDVNLINSQTWHRGAQNTSQRTRYLVTTAYGRRFISQRFFPFLNYQMPSYVLHGASDRLLRLLGRHEKGPYG